jgi:uncharacterized protein (TIGR03083 family)
MSDWDATDYAAKDNLLRVVRLEAEGLFEMAEAGDRWTAPTGCPKWEVRDIVGHPIDVTESYFTGFHAAATGGEVDAPLGVKVMQERLDEGAKTHRELTQDDAVERLRGDFGKMMEIAAALGPGEWGGQLVTHKYMGPLPAFFYPVFQLMDYGVHSWDIRQGTGRAHGLAGDTADLLVPFMFILWQGHHGGARGQRGARRRRPGVRPQRRRLPGEHHLRGPELRSGGRVRHARGDRVRSGKPGADRVRPDERGHHPG